MRTLPTLAVVVLILGIMAISADAQAATQLTLTVGAQPVCGGSNTPTVGVPVTARLTSNGVGVSGVLVVVTLGGGSSPSQIQTFTNTNGEVTNLAVTWNTPNTPAAPRILEARFNGNPQFQASSTQYSLVVNPATSALSATSVPLTGISTVAYTASVTLSRTSATLATLANVAVTFTFTAPGGGVTTLNTNTNNLGVATTSLVLTAAMVGNLQLSVTAAGVPVTGQSTACVSSPPTLQRTIVVTAALEARIEVEDVAATCSVAYTATARFTDSVTGATLPALTGVSWSNPSPAGLCVPSVTGTNAQGLAVCTFTTQTTSVSGNYNVVYTGTPGVPPRLARSASAAVSVRKCKTRLTVTSSPANSQFVLGSGVRTYLVALQRDETVTTNLGIAFPCVLSASVNGAAPVVVGTFNTNTGGSVTVVYAPSVPGTHALTLSFAGTPTCYDGSSVSLGTTAVFQKVLLDFDPSHTFGVCSPTAGPTLTTTLRSALTLGTPLAPADTAVPVVFDYSVPWSNPAVPADSYSGNTASLTTRGGFATSELGIATSARILAASAFSLFLATSSGGINVDIVSSGGARLEIQQAASSLTFVNPITTASVGQTVSFTATLRRAEAPVQTLPLNGPVVFTLTAPDGVTLYTAQSDTDANGDATVSFPVLTQTGDYAVYASFEAATGPYPGTNLLSCVGRTDSALAIFNSKTNIKVSLQPVSGVCGTDLPFVATVTRTDGSAVSGAPLTVTINALGGVYSCSNPTNAAGISTCTIFLDAAIDGSVDAVAVVSPTTEFGGATSDPVSVMVSTAPSSLAAVTVPATALVSDGLLVSTVIKRVSTNAGIEGLVSFTLVGPEGPNSITVVQQSRSTLGTGAVSTTFPLVARGRFKVSASFVGDTCLQGSATAQASVTIYQRVILAASAQASFCSDTLPVVCNLYAGPEGASKPITGQTVSFEFRNSANVLTPASGSAVTDAGVATLPRVFNPIGTYSLTCRFSNFADYFVNSAGVNAQSQITVPIVVSLIATQLQQLTPGAGWLVDTAMPTNIKLLLTSLPQPRTSPSGESIVIRLSPPSGQGSSTTVTDNTDSNGVATTTFGSSRFPVRGQYTLTSSFAQHNCYAAATTLVSPLTVYQRVKVALTAAQGTCGKAVTYSGQLTTQPEDDGLGNQQVVLNFGGAAPSVTLTTNGGGWYSYTVTIAHAGTYTVTATFSNPSNLYTNNAGDMPPQPEVATGTSVIASATTSLSSPSLSASTIYITNTVTVSSTLQRTSSPSGNVAGVDVSFVLTRVSDGAVVTLTDATNSNGYATVTFPSSAFEVVSQYTVVAKYAGSVCLAPVTSSSRTITMKQKTSLTMTSFTGTCDGALVSATLKAIPGPPAPPGAPVGGLTIKFTSGSKQCSGVTDSTGLASCNLVLSASGTYTVYANFYDSGIYEDSSTSATGTITKTGTTVVYSGRTTSVVGQTAAHAIFARGQGATLAAHLVSSASAAIAGRSVTLTVGTGSKAESCTGSTSSTGDVSCTTDNVYLALGPLTPISVSFAGDSCYTSSANSAVALIFAFPSYGAFAHGDEVVTPLRTFLAPDWFAKNPMSRSSLTNDNFKGFGRDIRSANGWKIAYPVCSGYVNAGERDHKYLPVGIPEYIGIVRTSTAFYDPKTGAAGPQETNDCSSNPCQHGGSCRNNYGGGYFCNCPTWWHGRRCEKPGYGDDDDDDDDRRGNGKGDGSWPHGNCNPSDSTIDAPTIVVLKVSSGGYCNGYANRLNDGHWDGDDGHDDHHGSSSVGGYHGSDNDHHHDDDEDDDHRRQGYHRSGNRNIWEDLLNLLHNNKPKPNSLPAGTIISSCGSDKTLKGEGTFVATYCP